MICFVREPFLMRKNAARRTYFEFVLFLSQVITSSSLVSKHGRDLLHKHTSCDTPIVSLL